MTFVTLDAATTALLCKTKELVEVRDNSGSVVGIFAPVELDSVHRNLEAAKAFDLAEIQKRKDANENGATTKELFEHLQSLTSDEETKAYLQKKIEVLAERDQWQMHAN